MTDVDASNQPGTGRRRQLADEIACLRTRIEEIRSSDRSRGPSPEISGEIARLEQRIAAKNEELARIELAVELERQQDA